MAMRRSFVAAASVAALAAAFGCRGDDAPAAEAETPTISVTRWTAKTELFAEYPPLVTGEVSRFAIHLTRLDTFKAVTEGEVIVELREGGRVLESFRVDGPSRPGIFGVDVKPAQAGKRDLVIILRSPGVTDEQDAGPVEVFGDEGAAIAAANAIEEAEGISFLKEQQWTLDFATAVVAERPVRESIRVPASISARPGGEADVAAPVTGRLVAVADLPIGAPVTRGRELARILPAPASADDLPRLEQFRAEAASALDLARRDRERAERLVTSGASPAKRLEDARAAEAQAAARLRSAESQIAQHNAARGGGSAGANAFSVRAPISGVISAREAATGANVGAGSLLFRVVDAANVHLVGQVPEAHASRARAARTAQVEVAGDPAFRPAGTLVSIGRVLDPRARTLPIIFAFDNGQFRLPVGQSVFLHLFTGETASAPVVPLTAVVDDAGRPIVFVQLSGETFERRPVTLGAREGDRVQVVSGLRAGDRVVTRGAHLVRLASLSSSVPAHGHAH